MYKHTSPKNKVYIGITSYDPYVRWGKGGIRYKGQPFYNAIQKYGWDNFKHEILFTNLSEQEAKKKEIELINEYKANDHIHGYNCTLGGNGVLGLKWSDESIQARIDTISKPIYQYSLNGDFIKKWKSAKTISDELGYAAPPIHACCIGKRKQAYGYIWREFYEESVEPQKIGIETIPVYQYSLNGDFIKEWESASHIENELGYKETNIRTCCKGKQHMAYGYIWRYEKYKNIFPENINQYNQYDLNGNYIQTFYSIEEASKALGHKHLAISQVCNGLRKLAGGYQWRSYKKDKIEPYMEQERIPVNRKIICQYDMKGNFIQEFSSIKLAEKYLGLKSSGGITMCATGKRKSAYGYIWKYKNT